MRRLVLALSVAVGLTLAPSAAAKGELVAVEVCGSSGCRTVEDERTLRSVPTGGETQEELGPAAPFYRVTFFVQAGQNTHEWTIYYVPSQNALAHLDPYDSMRALPIFGRAANGVMRRLVSGLRPFPAPHVTSVAVGEKELRGVGARGYLRLFDAGTGVPREDADEWVPIDLRSAEPTPWTEGARELLYSPDANAIARGGMYFELPDWLAADVEAARPLGSPQRGFPWLTVVLSLLGAATLAALAHGVPRRGRGDLRGLRSVGR